MKDIKRETANQLRRRIMELEAQLAHVYAAASRDIEKAGAQLMASGALVQVTALGGRQIIPPVVVLDGLSRDTIEALQRDFARSYELATMHKPTNGTKKPLD